MNEEQLGFPLDGMGAPPKRINPHDIRLELTAFLDIAKAAKDAAPWDLATLRQYRATLPDKANVLPPEEAEFLRRQLAFQFDRIELLLAA